MTTAVESRLRLADAMNLELLSVSLQDQTLWRDKKTRGKNSCFILLFIRLGRALRTYGLMDESKDLEGWIVRTDVIEILNLEFRTGLENTNLYNKELSLLDHSRLITKSTLSDSIISNKKRLKK